MLAGDNCPSGCSNLAEWNILMTLSTRSRRCSVFLTPERLHQRSSVLEEGWLTASDRFMKAGELRRRRRKQGWRFIQRICLDLWWQLWLPPHSTFPHPVLFFSLPYWRLSWQYWTVSMEKGWGWATLLLFTGVTPRSKTSILTPYLVGWNKKIHFLFNYGFSEWVTGRRAATWMFHDTQDNSCDINGSTASGEKPKLQDVA